MYEKQRFVTKQKEQNVSQQLSKTDKSCYNYEYSSQTKKLLPTAVTQQNEQKTRYKIYVKPTIDRFDRGFTNRNMKENFDTRIPGLFGSGYPLYVPTYLPTHNYFYNIPIYVEYIIKFPSVHGTQSKDSLKY